MVSASDRSLVHRSPTECDVFEYDLEASVIKKPLFSLFINNMFVTLLS